jgi:hypothetical protein
VIKAEVGASHQTFRKSPFNENIFRSNKSYLIWYDALPARLLPRQKKHQVTDVVDPGAAGGVLAGEPALDTFDFEIHGACWQLGFSGRLSLMNAFFKYFPAPMSQFLNANFPDT